jgi:hypothetical protein
MKQEPIRFCIGPWNGRYSSISLHQSGKFRAAFTGSYNQKMIEEGRDAESDRAFLKWDKKPVEENHIMQVLDIHFPLSALSLTHKPRESKGKEPLIIRPSKTSLGSNDTVTVKIIFHKLQPESEAFLSALKHRNIMPAFWFGLSASEYVTIAFQYTKKLPLKLEKEDEKNFAGMFHGYFTKSGKKVGDTIDGLTIMPFRMGLPPEVYNIGQISICWEAEKHFSVDIGGKAAKDQKVAVGIAQEQDTAGSVVPTPTQQAHGGPEVGSGHVAQTVPTPTQQAYGGVNVSLVAEALIDATPSESEQIHQAVAIMEKLSDAILTALSALPTPALMDEYGISIIRPSHVKALAAIILTDRRERRGRDFYLGLTILTGVITLVVGLIIGSLTAT